MSLFSQFATNRKAEVEGREFIFGEANADGSMPTFRLARMSNTNKRYKKMIDIETKPHIHAIRNDNLAPEIDEAITLKVFISTVLLGWKNVVVPEVFGSDDQVECTPDNAEKLFKSLPELFIALKENAQKMSNYRTEDIEADSKN
jgi:hypothetical protein